MSMKNSDSKKAPQKKDAAPKAPEADHSNDVRIGPLGKDGEKMMKSIEKGNMIAVLSGTEIMYTFIFRNQYQCFIHPIGAEEGRHRAWEINERNRAMLKNLDSAADQLFEIEFAPDMDFMGVMVAAEKGIYNFLCTIGETPGEDVDFMEEMRKAYNPEDGDTPSS